MQIIIIIIIIKHICRAHFRRMPQMRYKEQLHVTQMYSYFALKKADSSSHYTCTNRSDAIT